MYLQHTTISFRKYEVTEIKGLINYQKLEKATRNKNQNEILKQALMSYLASVKDSHRNTQQFNRLLKQKKIETDNKQKRGHSYCEISDGLSQLRKYLAEKQNDSECYTFYVSFLNQIKDMKPDSLASFQKNLYTITKLSFYEKDNIKWVAGKILKSRQNEQKISSIQLVPKIITEILRYGFQHQIRDLQYIKDKNLLQKIQTLIKHVNDNFIEIQPRIYSYGKQNCFKQFMQKIVSEYHKSQDLYRLVQKMPRKLRNVIEPLLQYVLQLRQSIKERQSTKDITKPSYTRGVYYPSYQLKKAQEQSIEQLISDFGKANKKIDTFQAQINDLKRFIVTVSGLTSNSMQKELTKNIQEYIQSCQGEELRHSLLKIYQKFNNYGYKQPVYKTFKENRQNQLLTEKLNKRIAKLQEEILKNREEIRELDQQKTQSLDERIQLSQSIQQYKQKIEEKNKQIIKLQKSAQELKKVKEQKAKLQNVIRLLQEREEQRVDHFTNESNKNKFYKQTIDRLTKQKQTLIEQNAKLERQLAHKDQLNQKSQQDRIKSQTSPSQQLVEKKGLTEAQIFELQKLNKSLSEVVAQLRMENQQLNNKIREVQDLQKTVEQVNKQNDILTHKLEILIKTKEIGSEKGTVMHQRENLLGQIEMLKGQLSILTQNEIETRQREQQCERQLENLKTLFSELSQEQQRKRIAIQQLQNQNQGLNRDILRLRDANQELQGFKMKYQASRQNKFLQNQLEEAKKLNELIKSEYMNFKEQSKNAYKLKLEEETLKYKQNQEKLRENYRKLHELFTAQKDKMAGLKTENQQFTQDRSIKSSKQLISLQNSAQKSDLQEKYKDIMQKYQSLKTFSQRQQRKKQQQIANLKLQLIRVERNNSNDDLHQLRITKQKLEYLQGEVYELQEQNSRLKMQLERREQQILILKTQALK